MFEISLTPFGADEATQVYEAASLGAMLDAGKPIEKIRADYERHRERGFREIAKAEAEFAELSRKIEENQAERSFLDYYARAGGSYE